MIKTILMICEPARNRFRALGVSILLGLAMALAGAHAAEDSARTGGGIVGQFRGYEAVNRTLQTRLFRPGESLVLSIYIGENGGFSGGGMLSDLLGTYNGAELGKEFRNGKPNPVNGILWYLIMSGFGRDLALDCKGTSLYRRSYRPEVRAAVDRLCAWPAASARNEEALTRLWFTFVSFDMPIEEFHAWKAFFLGPDFAESSAEEAIAAMITTMLTHPHFLLRK